MGDGGGLRCCCCCCCRSWSSIACIHVACALRALLPPPLLISPTGHCNTLVDSGVAFPPPETKPSIKFAGKKIGVSGLEFGGKVLLPATAVGRFFTYRWSEQSGSPLEEMRLFVTCCMVESPFWGVCQHPRTLLLLRTNSRRISNFQISKFARHFRCSQKTKTAAEMERERRSIAAQARLASVHSPREAPEFPS